MYIYILIYIYWYSIPTLIQHTRFQLFNPYIEILHITCAPFVML